MKAYIGITDRNWFDLLSSRPQLDEVNFWQPSGKRQFLALKPGELFLFKLHSPEDYIVGGGIFAHFALFPISMAWEAFVIGNGARNLSEMRSRVAKYRRQEDDRSSDYTIGCILLEQPFFLPRHAWIPVPADWSSNIVQGRGYDLTVEPGRSLWSDLQTALTTIPALDEAHAKYGDPVLTFPRLGQGSFRVLVTDAYARRCALTGERTLPALESAHIKPYAESGPHFISNGILLRRDLHALFDRGYMTVTPSCHVEVSRRIKEEFENGRDYYRHHGALLRMPPNPAQRPAEEFLQWHNEHVYKG